jgi:hypothetical protein
MELHRLNVFRIVIYQMGYQANVKLLWVANDDSGELRAQ